MILFLRVFSICRVHLCSLLEDDCLVAERHPHVMLHVHTLPDQRLSDLFDSMRTTLFQRLTLQFDRDVRQMFGMELMQKIDMRFGGDATKRGSLHVNDYY